MGFLNQLSITEDLNWIWKNNSALVLDLGAVTSTFLRPLTGLITLYKAVTTEF